MGALIGIMLALGLTAGAIKHQGELPKKWEPKPCDVLTGCKHPAFK